MSETPRVVIGAGRFEKGSREYLNWSKRRKNKNGHEDSLVPSLVLEFTLRKYCPDVEIVNTYAMARPQFKRRVRPTPFSMVRFWVPELMNYQGRAAYMDADMIVFADVREMFEAATGDHKVWATLQDPSVCIIDCEKCRGWNARQMCRQCDVDSNMYNRLRNDLLRRDGKLPEEWNHRDVYLPGKTRLLHYTRLSTQPWHQPKNPLGQVWLRELWEALEAGVIPEDRLKEAEGYVNALGRAS